MRADIAFLLAKKHAAAIPGLVVVIIFQHHVIGVDAPLVATAVRRVVLAKHMLDIGVWLDCMAGHNTVGIWLELLVPAAKADGDLNVTRNLVGLQVRLPAWTSGIGRRHGCLAGQLIHQHSHLLRHEADRSLDLGFCL